MSAAGNFSTPLALRLLFIGMVLGVSVAHGEENIGSNGDHELIAYDLLGGMLPRRNSEPLLRIYRSGRLVLGNPSGRGKRITTTLPPQQLKQLLMRIVEEQRFMEISTEKVKSAIASAATTTGRLFLVADSGTSLFRVTQSAVPYEVRVYALATAARRYPSIRSLQNLLNIQKMLRDIIIRARIGGEARMLEELQRANSALLRSYPQARPLSLEHLQQVVSDTEGNLTLYFYRREMDDRGRLMSDVQVKTRLPKSGAPEISIPIYKVN
ncbi:MAG: hypothetical protein ABW185_09005 [Sedimenticola sp.]